MGCTNCPGQCEGPTKPFDLPKGGRIEIHGHMADHDFRNQGPGPVEFHTMGAPMRIVKAGESIFVPKGSQHWVIALEDTKVHCDFGKGATEADTHPVRMRR